MNFKEETIFAIFRYSNRVFGTKKFCFQAILILKNLNFSDKKVVFMLERKTFFSVIIYLV